MNIDYSKLMSAGAFFLVIFATGFWLSRTGKPYSTALFTIHKLIALAAVVFLVVTYTQAHKSTPLTALDWAAVTLTLACFAGTIVSGGLLSLEKPVPAALGGLHRVLPFLSLLGTAASIYLTRAVWVGMAR